MIKKFKLPKGIQDYLPEDCYSKRILEGKLMDCFKYYGFREIESPVLERYELFDGGVGNVELNKLFKVADIDGDLLVLRPDITMPISRIVCTKLQGGCQKLCYLGNSFSAIENEGKLREFTQAGIEIMGAEGDGIDVEVVMLAIKSLLAAGLEDFQIELGNVAFFEGLLDAFSINEEDSEILVNSIESKNGIKLYSLSGDMDQRLLESLAKLPMLFGGEEVLADAEKMCLNDKMLKAVQNLESVYAGLKQLGYEKYVCFDLSIVGKMRYYSGMVMRGIVKGLGRPVLSGGRYDGLCDAFGQHTPAVGFAVSIGYLMTALQKYGLLQNSPEVEVIVGYEPEMMKKAESYVDGLRAKGINAVCSFATDKAMLKENQEITKAKKAVFVTKKDIAEC